MIGRSGCGKSTLLNVVSGLVAPTSGSVTLGSKRITSPGRDRASVRSPSSRGSGLKVDFALGLGGVPANARPALVAEHLELVRLSGTENLYPKELSGGMRKRLAIAMVLANKPDMMLMDEPFGALDYATKVEMQLEVVALHESRPLTTMFVELHDVEEAVFLADRVVVMAGGSIIDDVAVPLSRPRDLASRTVWHKQINLVESRNRRSRYGRVDDADISQFEVSRVSFQPSGYRVPGRGTEPFLPARGSLLHHSSSSLFP